MLHDGGGDRSQTVAALDRLIDELQERGYTFDTVSSAVQADPALARGHAAQQRLQGRLVSGLVRLLRP